MTTEQKNRVASLRSAGQGYTAIARELGLSKSAISNFCRKNGLGENSLLNEPVRGNTVNAESLENKRPKHSETPCVVTRVFADVPDPDAITDVLGMLMNAR